MFQDDELEDLYSQLDKLCNPQPQNTNAVKEITTILTTNQAVNSSSSIKELEALINDLEDEEKLGKMDKNDLFMSTNKAVVAAEENSLSQNISNRFIGKPVSADGIFSNIKHNIRQSNKKRIEAYANTNAKVVKESNMEPLKLQQYTEK